MERASDHQQEKNKPERWLPGLKGRVLQLLARIAPGAMTTRVHLNRWRGVKIGKDVWIGYDAIIETSCPHLVTIRDRAAIGIRATIIAHNREQQGVLIEEDVTLGPGVIVLPNVTIGRGAIVTAGSVVTKSVPPKTMVQGNPAQPIATVDIPLGLDVSVKEFAKGLRLTKAPRPAPGGALEERAGGKNDPLFRFLTDFFNLPPHLSPQEITQEAVSSWDSLAMVQLIADLQGTFSVKFDLDEIEELRSYEEIRRALSRKGVSLNKLPVVTPSRRG
jgi:acetyltransferase-like isoleucine patch superfamily enzyme/acyl carrier protein